MPCGVSQTTATLDEMRQQSCPSLQPVKDSSQNITDCNPSELERDGSHELSTCGGEIAEADSDCMQQQRKVSPERRTVATQTDAYDSEDDDDETSDEETSSSSDAETDTSSIYSSRDSVNSNVSSPFAPDRCLDDGSSLPRPDAVYSNNSPSVPEEGIDKVSSEDTEMPAFSDKSGESLTSRLSSTDSSNCLCADETSTKQMPSPAASPSSERKSVENRALDADAAASDAAVTSVVDGAVSPGVVDSRLCDGADRPSSASGTRLQRSVAVAPLSEASPTETRLDAADRVSSFKMPGCSPDDVCRLAADASCGAYSSPQSNYGGGGVSSDCSPPSCGVPPPQGSLGGGVAYSMPTPSPTNSSARSFSMASPGSYPQLASVSQLEPSCCQMEPNVYQPAASLPASAASYRQPPMDSYHQTMTPPMERVGSQCTSDYMYPSYHFSDVGSPGMSQMMGWQSLYLQQQQGVMKPVEFASRGQVMSQNVGQAGCRSSSASSLGCRSDVDRQRRYAAKDCNKTVASRSRTVPNVAVQPGTNMISGYDVYGPSECTGNPRGAELVDYRASLHQRSPALGYHGGGYVSDHPRVGVPANVYHYQQPVAGGYAAGVQSNHIRGQSVCPYGYMNRTLVGHNSFDMNLMRH